MRGYVYILESLKNGRFYVGSTENLERRLKEHRDGNSFYVKNYIGLFKLVFSQIYEDISQARKIEMWLKLQKDKDFLKKIISDGVIKKVIY